MRMRARTAARTGIVFVGALALLGCRGAPEVPAHPTWSNVQPILAGECAHCHGSTARITGAGARLDFYELTPEVCGDAALAVTPGAPMARFYATGGALWKELSTTADRPDQRPRMPPPPAPYLAEWEWQTIQTWLRDGAPKGAMPTGNLPPRITLTLTPGVANDRLAVDALVEDQDGDAAVGLVRIGDFTLNVDRTGTFSTVVNTSAWPTGERPVSAVLCDGWSSTTIPFGTVTITHPQ